MTEVRDELDAEYLRAREILAQASDTASERVRILDDLLIFADWIYDAWEEVIESEEGDAEKVALEEFLGVQEDYMSACDAATDLLSEEELDAAIATHTVLHVALLKSGVIEIACAACGARGKMADYTRLEPPNRFFEEYGAELCPACAAKEPRE